MVSRTRTRDSGFGVLGGHKSLNRKKGLFFGVFSNLGRDREIGFSSAASACSTTKGTPHHDLIFADIEIGAPKLRYN